MSSLEADVNACNQAGGSFHDTLSKTLTGLLHANQERKSEIDGLRSDHDNLRKDHDAFVTSAERENDLRRNEIKSLEERMQKENQVCKYTKCTMLQKLLKYEVKQHNSKINLLLNFALNQF